MLNPVVAEKLAKKYLLDKRTKEGEFIFAHTKGVVLSVQILSKKFNLDKDKMISLAWMHDIGYFLNDTKNHAENSLRILDDEKIKLNEIDKDCILNHGTGKTPSFLEGKIMQIADKLSILNPDFLEVLLSKKNFKEDELDFVKMMCEKAIEMLKKLNDTNKFEYA